MNVHFPEDLAHLVAQVQSQVYAHPQRAIEAARELIKRVHSEEHLAYVYEQLGFAHLILAEHRLSCLFYEQALALQPRNMYVLANLAHALYELCEHPRAVDMGRAALQIEAPKNLPDHIAKQVYAVAMKAIEKANASARKIKNEKASTPKVEGKKKASNADTLAHILAFITALDFSTIEEGSKEETLIVEIQATLEGKMVSA
jgi:tetratricopeptide (TPR) repeat protein